MSPLPVVLLGLALPAAPPTCMTPDDWDVELGVLTAVGCRTFIGATADGTTAYSAGTFYLREPVRPPYVLDVRMRRLSPDARSIEVIALGARILLQPGRVALWISDEDFARDGWRHLAGLRTDRINSIRVIHTAVAIELWLGGRRVERFPWRAPRSGRVGFQIKGPLGGRARLWLDGVTVSRRSRRR